MKDVFKKDKGALLTLIGAALILIFAASALLPRFSKLLGGVMVVGIAFFFIVEFVTKTPDEESGLRFKTFFSDFKKPGVLFWVLLPIGLTLLQIFCGKLFFYDSYKEYVDHIMGRTSFIDWSNLPARLAVGVVSALGEEIAFRGFFTGKGAKLFGFWPAALLSSAAFALAHFAPGPAVIVIVDLAGVFIDGVMYSIASHKANNCLISTVPHYVNNVIGFILVPLLFF